MMLAFPSLVLKGFKMRTSEPLEGHFEELEGRKEAALEGGLSIIFIQSAQLGRKLTGRLHCQEGKQAPSGPCFQKRSL